MTQTAVFNAYAPSRARPAKEVVEQPPAPKVKDSPPTQPSFAIERTATSGVYSIVDITDPRKMVTLLQFAEGATYGGVSTVKDALQSAWESGYMHGGENGFRQGYDFGWDSGFEDGFDHAATTTEAERLGLAENPPE